MPGYRYRIAEISSTHLAGDYMAEPFHVGRKDSFPRLFYSMLKTKVDPARTLTNIRLEPVRYQVDLRDSVADGQPQSRMSSGSQSGKAITAYTFYHSMQMGLHWGCCAVVTAEGSDKGFMSI